MTTDSDSEPPSDPLKDIRPSPIAGRWYSNSPHKLSREIDGFLDVALPPLGGKVIGVVAPHAGYLYSGATAGYAFAAVKGAHYSRVAILSPLHAYHPAPVLTSGHNAYSTPLGSVPVDQAALDALENELSASGISLVRIKHDEEHSLEIELPFLQRALTGSFTLIPLMIRSQNPAQLEALAQSLHKILSDTETLLVASTDLSHFYPEQTAHKFDTEMLHQIEQLSPEGVLAAERTGSGMACGCGAVAAVLWTARLMGADWVKILHQTTSAEITGNSTSVVGYGAAAIIKKS
jgi:AmmeMemoRadiSam system protein B